MRWVDLNWTRYSGGLLAVRVDMALALPLASSSILARHSVPPYNVGYPANAGLAIPIAGLRPIDAERARALADEAADASGPNAKRRRVPDDTEVSVHRRTDGLWQALDDAGQSLEPRDSTDAVAWFATSLRRQRCC